MVINWKGGPISPTSVRSTAWSREWINPWSTVSNCGSFHYPCDRQNGWCHYPLGINYYGYWLESALQNRTKNEQRINWSRSSLSRPETRGNLWSGLSNRVTLDSVRIDRFSKDRQDLSHNRRENSGPSESEVYVVLTSLCCCFETKFINSSKSCSTPSFIYLPNLSFINKYIFSWDLLSFFIIHFFLFMLIDVIQKFTPITFDYFIHAGSHVLHFWNKTFNIIRVNSSHLISLYESINAAT